MLEETAKAQAKAGGTSRDMQMRILNLGRAAQDLAQGGFAGIINNIEGIVGGGGIAAGVLTAIGTAAFIATPFIKEWVKSLGEGGEKFRPVVEGMEKFTDAINKNKKELEELKAKQELNYWELLRYKELVHETTQLEDGLATAREARMVKAGSSKKEQARGAAVRETIAEVFGSGESLIESILDTNAGKQAGQKRVEELIAGAQKGFPADIMSLGNLFPKFREAYTPFSPERQAQLKQAEESLKAEHEAQAKKEKRIKEQEENKKRSDAEADRVQKKMDDDAKRDSDNRGRANARHDDQFRRGLPKLKQDIQDAKDARQVQKEQAWMGNDVNFNQALEFVKTTKAAIAREQKNFNNEAIGATAELGQQLRDTKAQTAEIRAVRQQNRTAASNGMF